jgi:hypothetical protein
MAIRTPLSSGSKEFFYGKECNKKARMDSGAYPDLEDDGSKEKNSVEYRPETEANRGCDSAKGFQYGVVARLSDLSLLLAAAG